MKCKLWLKKRKLRKIKQNFIEGDPIHDQSFRDSLNKIAADLYLPLPFTKKRDIHD